MNSKKSWGVCRDNTSLFLTWSLPVYLKNIPRHKREPTRSSHSTCHGLSTCNKQSHTSWMKRWRAHLPNVRCLDHLRGTGFITKKRRYYNSRLKERYWTKARFCMFWKPHGKVHAERKRSRCLMKDCRAILHGFRQKRST